MTFGIFILFLSDIEFQLEDGVVALHKPILMARCEMMFAMFSANFLESSAEIVCRTAYKYENHSLQH